MAVWPLSVEYPLYNPTKNCVHKWCWTPGWEKCSVSISLTPSLCPNVAPHSSLFFTSRLFCSAGWKLVSTLTPEWGQSPWVCHPLESTSALQHHSEPKAARLSHDNSCSCTAGSCTQHMDKHMIFEWTTRWVENWPDCQDRRVVISSSKSKRCPSGINGRANTV